MSREYDALIEKVDAFCGEAEDQAREALACQRGCSACCHVWLDVSPVEARAMEKFVAAQPSPAREALAQRGEREAARQAQGAQPARCPMLDDGESCAVYPARPLICRTQGLALRYPPDTVPASTVRFRTGDGDDVVACPLNYTERDPRGAEVLDADRVNTLLALVNRRHAENTGDDPSARVSLLAIARAADDESQ